MGKLEIAIMEPKYQVNLGYLARVAKNFGFSSLTLINPRCKHTGMQAIKYSKHARDLLINAKIAKSVKQLRPNLLIGTTGVWHKSNSSYYNIYDPKNMAKLARMASKAGGKTVLLIGRDDMGLSREELAECDALVFIGANREYPILNISHALAIMLYELNFADMKKEYNLELFYSSIEQQERLIRLFDLHVRSKENIKNKKAVSAAFRRIIRRSIPTKKEVNALSAAFSRN